MKRNDDTNSGGKGNDGNGTDNESKESSYMSGMLSNESIYGTNYNTFRNNSSNININNNLDGSVTNNNLESGKHHDLSFQKQQQLQMQ